MDRIKALWGSLFRNPDKVKAIIAVFAIVLMISTATRCHGSEVEWGAGMTVARQQSAVIKFDIVWPKAGPIDADYRCGLVLIGASIDTGEDRNNAAVQCQVVDGFGKFDIGLGLVALQHTDALNGSTVNFSLSLGYRFGDHFAITYGHWSNAGTVKPNTGRDMVFFSWRFK